MFQQAHFLRSSNIYEVNLRQFTKEGTIASFKKHLPRLQKMGVQILWFMPVYPIGTINRKGTLGSYYSVKDFCAINSEFGTLADFKELVVACHALGIKVILDWVANHAAWDNIWTATHPDYFERDDAGNFKSPYDWTDVIQIDHRNPSQQNAMLKAMEFWITECDIDGYRADLAHLTPLPFWLAARRHLSTVKQDLVWLAETEEPDYHQAFDISYTWKWMHATEQFVKQKLHLPDLVQLLKTANADFGNALRMFFTSNHDENSWNGTEYEKYGLYAHALAVFSCTYENSVPLIYSGQELPLLKRLHFFEKDEIEWASEPIQLTEFYSTLLQYRKREPLFTNSDGCTLRFILDDENVLAFERSLGENAMVVILNFSSGSVDGALPTNLSGRFRNIFTGACVSLNSTISYLLHPGKYLVLEKLNE